MQSDYSRKYNSKRVDNLQRSKEKLTNPPPTSIFLHKNQVQVPRSEEITVTNGHPLLAVTHGWEPWHGRSIGSPSAARRREVEMRGACVSARCSPVERIRVSMVRAWLAGRANAYSRIMHSGRRAGRAPAVRFQRIELYWEARRGP